MSLRVVELGFARLNAGAQHWRNMTSASLSLLSVVDGTDAYAISFWASKEKAEQYSRASYPEVLKAMAVVVQGTPEVLSYEVCSSTTPKITVRA